MAMNSLPQPGPAGRLHSRSTTTLACSPPNVQSLAQCPAEYVSHKQTHQNLGKHKVTSPVPGPTHVPLPCHIHTCTRTHIHLSTQSHYMHLIAHVHRHAYLVWYKYPPGHTILMTPLKVPGPCLALNTHCAPAPAHSPSGWEETSEAPRNS